MEAKYFAGRVKYPVSLKPEKKYDIYFQGGRHTDHVADQIVTKLIEVVKKKNKGGVKIKPFQVYTPYFFDYKSVFLFPSKTIPKL